MDYILNSDFYEIRLASLVTNVDKDVLVELYQPIIGSNATILYLTLLKQKRNEDDESTHSMESLINVMQMQPGMLLSARHFLEAVGLLRTYVLEKDGSRYFIYVLYAPKSPKDFFDDVLFKGLLIQSIGEKAAKKLAFSYKTNLKIDEEFTEISESFVNVFHPDYDDASFKKDFGNSLVGQDAGRVKIQFNYDLFFGYVSDNSQIKTSAFSKKDMKEIERLSALFGLDEKNMAFIVTDEYDPNTIPHLNFAHIKERAEEQVKYRIVDKKPIVGKSDIKSDTVISNKIKMMDELAPAKFLRFLQNNTMPASADLKIIDSLSSGYGFPNGVINAIIEYVLYKNNNMLSRNYCEKVASTLARSNITNALDAMNTLNKIGLSKKEAVSKIKKPQPIQEIIEESPEQIEKEKVVEHISDEEMDALLSSFEKLNKGGK